jgi:alpha-beta hydrolase superfamily lysophospholipase
VDRRSRIHPRGRSIEITALIDDAECKVHLVGHSCGGALRVAAERPRRQSSAAA